MKTLIILIAIIYTVGAALAIYEIVKAPLVKDDIKEWEDKV